MAFYRCWQVEEEQRSQEDQTPLIHNIIRKYKVLEMLKPNTFGKRYPIRCWACTSQSQPNGKIFEGSKWKAESIQFFCSQHCRGITHVSNTSRYIREQRGETAAPVADDNGFHNFVPCVGLCLTDCAYKCSLFSSEMLLWAKNMKLATALKKHTYTLDMATQNLVVRHSECEKLVLPPEDGNPAVCSKCLDPNTASSALKCCIKFANKYWGAKILQAKLFKSQAALDDVINEFKETVLYKRCGEQVSKILKLDELSLQKWVRQSFTKISHNTWTETFAAFMETVVMPCLRVNVAECTGELKGLAQQFASSLASHDLSDVQSIAVRIAKASCSGKLAGNPAIVGIILQCIEQLDRSERGINTMKRPRNMSEQEREMVADAAALLSINGANAKLMKILGFNRASARHNCGRVHQLLEHSLPCPALSLLFPEVLAENLNIISSRIPKMGKSMQRFVVAFDFTYVLPMHVPMLLHGKHHLVGAPFHTKHISEESPLSFLKIEDEVVLEDNTKANRLYLSSSEKSL